MRVTPLEIRQQQFPIRFRGYDSTEVDAFVELVAGQVEDLIKENARLREALAQQEQEILRVREAEADWKKALMVVQQTREDLISRGEKQAQLVLAEAQREAQQILIEAAKQRDAIDHAVQELMDQRRQLVLQIHSLLKSHLKLLEEQKWGRSDDVVRPLSATSAPPQDSGEFDSGVEGRGKRVENGTGRKSKRRAATVTKRARVP